VSESLAEVWLVRHCALLPGVVRAVVLLAPQARGGARVAASWPDAANAGPDLLAIASAALQQARVVLQASPPGPGASAERSRLGVPFGSGAAPMGAVALEVEKAVDPDLIEELRAAAGSLELLTRSEAVQRRLVTVLEAVGIALDQPGFEAAATAIAAELATRLELERVSIGFRRRDATRVAALSHSAGFDARANLIRDLEHAMDEACDQDATVVHPAPRGAPGRITRAHEELVRDRDAGACTVPIARRGEIIGAFTFESAGGHVFDVETVRLCESVASLVGPILELVREAQAPGLERLRERLRTRIAELSAPGHTRPKVVAGAAVALLLLLGFASCSYRVTADATLEGAVQRALVAGLDGYIAEATVRAGDVVRKGQPLGRLDDRDLQVERRKWAARRDQLNEKHRQALAAGERGMVNVLSAKLAQAEAQLELFDDQLARTQLVAPFDGIVVKGDLSQSLGTPVKRGELLFELAPLEGYRVILEVDDRDIADVVVGERGRLALSALPGEDMAFAVERITPVSTAEDGRNYFRVEARLEQPSEALRPGMTGVAKIDAGSRRLAWIWTHRFLDWLRLWTWSWWP